MNRKVKEIAKTVSDVISDWSGVEVIIFNKESTEDIYDPNFSIDFDVYHESDLPGVSERRMLFGNPAVFFTNPMYPLDRFLVGELPVLVHYRNKQSIENLPDRIEHNEWVYRYPPTSILHRIQNGEIMYSTGDWFEKLKQKTLSPKDEFWKNLMDSSLFLIEHFLMEIGAAVITGNQLFYQNTLNNFIQNVCSFIYAANRKFMPSDRNLFNEMMKLEKLPDEFLSRFQGIIRPDSEFSPEKKREIAVLLTKSLLSLERA
ncbi:MAG: DUF4037 domain-containing protein [Spirochaetales bacterium]|nr:DUF4037 domain-containing protein [Spirochaetales bacterium]